MKKLPKIQSSTALHDFLLKLHKLITFVTFWVISNSKGKHAPLMFLLNKYHRRNEQGKETLQLTCSASMSKKK